MLLLSCPALWWPRPLQVIDGHLAPFLSKVIKFASAHVLGCTLCRQKGFICELCHSGHLIYPFQDSATRRSLFVLQLILAFLNDTPRK